MKWIRAKPLKNFSSQHEGVLLSLFGLELVHISSVMSFNVMTPLPRELNKTFTIHTHPVEGSQKKSRADFCIEDLRQWAMDLTPFKTFDDYLHHLNYKQRYNHQRTDECFAQQGCKVNVIDGDWSEYADRAYALYHHVASKYTQIFDIDFFRTIAKLPNYKLICAWCDQKLIGAIVTVEEGTTIHSMVCGLDYLYSKRSFTYSKLHYEFIRHAIASGRFKSADVGVTADQAKKTLGFSPTPAIVEITAKNRLIRGVLRLANTLLRVSINAKNQVSVSVRWPRFTSPKSQ